MTYTGIVIVKESWAVLQNEPLYSARFITREGAGELVLVVRVEELDWFVEAHPPLTYTLTTWCSPQGIWVAALAYQLHPAFEEPKGGIFYLDPNQPADAEILQPLLQQDSLYVIFFSADCRDHYTTRVVQSLPELVHRQQLSEVIDRALAGGQCTSNNPADFAAALQEFQAHYSAADLFAGVSRN